jgi:hypothetical protein
MKVWAAIHHGPSSAGMARHLAPFCKRRTIASIVRRNQRIGRGAQGRTWSSKGSRADHCSSVITCISPLLPALVAEVR